MRKRNISPERLIEAIKEYIDRKGSFDTIAEKYGISYETIRSGFIRYKENGISTFIETKHNAVYTEELKTKAVIEYLQGKGSQTGGADRILDQIEQEDVHVFPGRTSFSGQNLLRNGTECKSNGSSAGLSR